MSAPNFPANSSSPDLLPDQFLYGRKGPWPQPSPTHPLQEAAEVLNVPLVESLVWDATVGLRLLKGQAAFPALAAYDAMEDSWTKMSDLSDGEFDHLMLGTAYTRYMKEWKPNPKSEADKRHLDKAPYAVKFWKYDFSAMKLVKPLEGLYCAPVVCVYTEDGSGTRSCLYIRFRGETDAEDVFVFPGDNAWNLAKIYVLQACAYHMLFVVHPALHFPMDSVNAITKTAVPHTHPLFQLLYPHTSYTLALDNAVLEGPNSVVNNNAQGTWFDPLMGNAYNLKLLFGAGYSGLQDPWYGDAYPPYDFMKPQMGFDSPYGQWLADYFAPFLTFCKVVAAEILGADPHDPYVKRWARYNSTYVRGFPDENAILDVQTLAQAMAIYMWDVTVSHGGDHYSFGLNVPAKFKFLRIRNFPPPSSASAASPTYVGDVANGDDLHRAELAQKLFFGPHAMPPNLNDTYYAFTNYNFIGSLVMAAQKKFHDNLKDVSKKYDGKYSLNTPFMPLTEDQAPDLPKSPYPVYTKYELTIPASIQY
jgi:hypothetical protein